MRCTSSRSSFSTRSTGNGGRTPGTVSIDSTGEVHGGGQNRGPGYASTSRRSGGHGGPLAEELDLGSAAFQYAVHEQAHDVIVTKRPHHGGAGLWSERNDIHPEGRVQQLDERAIILRCLATVTCSTQRLQVARVMRATARQW